MIYIYILKKVLLSISPQIQSLIIFLEYMWLLAQDGSDSAEQQHAMARNGIKKQSFGWYHLHAFPLVSKHYYSGIVMFLDFFEDIFLLMHNCFKLCIQDPMQLEHLVAKV